MFEYFRRRDYQNRYTNRPKPLVPDFRDAPHITGDLDHTLTYLSQTAGQSNDFVVRHTEVGERRGAVVYYLTMVDQKVIATLLKSLQRHQMPKRLSARKIPSYLANHVISHPNVVFMQNLWEIRESLSRGEVVLLIDGVSVAITSGAQSVPHRDPETPLLESSTRGPQVAFVENIEVNIGLIRKSLTSDALNVKQVVVGYRSRTRVALVFQHDVANPELVNTALKRIEAVHIDKLTGSATLEQRIVDNHWTIFPLTRATTRLDNCIKEIGQGKVLILVDGDPTGMLIPATITDFFQTMEDDQHSYFEATIVRWLRVIAFILALYLPALYVAFSDFNPELMPQILSLQIARSREGVPFNAAVEVMLMQIAVEILREATLRMPKVMGQTIGVVGGLVIGESSVQAGLVSNILVVIIALCALSVFVIPSYEFATVLRLMSWTNIIGASIFGLYGILLVAIASMFHIASLKSFGIDYMTPMGGEHWKDLFYDGIFRLPIPLLDKRAEHLHTQESTRSADYTDPVQNPMLEKADGVKGAKMRGST